MGRFVLTDEARTDLDEIRDYIARDSPEQAREVLRKLRGTMSELADMPGLGHRRDDLTAEDLLFKGVYSYLVIYRPGTKPLQVIAVMHGRRDIKLHLEDR